MICSSRVMDLLNKTDPSSVRLDEAKAEQILGLTDSTLLLICSQTPIIKKLVKSCQWIHYFKPQNYVLICGYFSMHMFNMCQIPVR